MFLSLEKLKKMSDTAKIAIQPAEEEFLVKTVNEEFSHVDMVLEPNTEGQEPMLSPNESLELVRHNDEVLDGDKTEELMTSAPNNLYNYFVVPKVIKKEE